MRRILDAIYLGSGILGAVFICAILVVVGAQVSLNILDSLIGYVTGSPIGLLIPSYAEFAGFFLAAASFFALPYTLRRGGHIRVNLLLHNVPHRVRHVLELWCSGAAAVVSGYATWYMVSLIGESLQFWDVSPGMVAVPLWIPQTALALGLGILTLALVDDFVTILRGGDPSYETEAATGVLQDVSQGSGEERKD